VKKRNSSEYYADVIDTNLFTNNSESTQKSMIYESMDFETVDHIPTHENLTNRVDNSEYLEMSLVNQIKN